MTKIQRLPYLNTYRGHAKTAYLNTTIDDSLFLPALDANKMQSKMFVESFELALSKRGESVNSALITLRARGFILHRSSLNRWKRGLLPNYNSLQFNILAQYAGYPSFIEMLIEQRDK